MGHFGKVCRQKQPGTNTGQNMDVPQTKTLTVNDFPLIQLSELSGKSIVPAPTVSMHISTCNGQGSFDILPDSGADISAAGPQFVQVLGECMDNLAESSVTPKAVNGSILEPVGKIPNVAFSTNGRTVHDDVHIYASVTRALIPCKELNILPSAYWSSQRNTHQP